MLSLNKDRRSLLFCMLLGDGSLFFSGGKRKDGKRGVAFQLIHGDSQVDYLMWKKKILESISRRELKTYSYMVKTKDKFHKSHRVKVTMRRFRAWRKFCYPKGKKDISRILPYIRHPEMAMAIWLMDDGTVNYQKSKKYADLRIHTDSEKPESIEFIVSWINDNFDVDVKIYMRKSKGKSYPTLRFNKNCGIKIWSVVRELILNIPSMKHKFRHFETFYQSNVK